MAARKRRTTSATRGKNKGKGQSKVTGKTPQSRANRQRTSTARVTRSGQGGGRGRVTNASQRTSTGSARVTGKPQLALPPGKKGGSLVKPKSQTSRQAAARVKAAKAAKGSKGGTRVGQPAGSANRMYGANVVNKAVNRATKAVKGARRLNVGRGGLATLALMAANKIQDRMLSPAARKRKRENEIRPLTMADMPGRSKPKTKKPADPKAVAKLTQPGGLFYRGPKGGGSKTTPSKKSGGGSSSTTTTRRAAAPAAPKKAATPKKATPKKKTSGVSGVGPVASGRTYSVKKTGMSVMQQQAAELRKMREASKKRQAADKAKSKKKKR